MTGRTIAATTAALRIDRTRPRVAVAADAAAVAGVVVVAVALAGLLWGRWGDLDSDTGFDLVAGARIADGELPYRDFTYYYGPLSAGAAGAASAIGGPGIGPGVVLGLLLTAAILGATYALARTFLDPLGSFLATAIAAGVAFAPNNYAYVLPHTYASPLGTLLLLCLLLALVRRARGGPPGWLVAAGTCAGLAALTKPEAAAAALAAALAWLAHGRRAGSLCRGEVARLALPALGLPALIYGLLMLAVSPRELVLGNLWPVDELRAGGDTLVRARMPLTAGSVAEVALKGLLYGAGAVALARAGDAIAGARPALRRRLLIACAVAGAAVVAASAARPDGLRDAFYYAWGWIPLGALAAAVFAWRRRAPAAIVAATALTVLAASSYAFTLHGWRPQMSVYAAPLAAILLARVHLVELGRSPMARRLGVAWVAFLAVAGAGLALREAAPETVRVSGPGGTLRETAEEGTLYRRALAEIGARTRPGKPVLVTPLMTGLNVLSDRPSPLRQISTLPTALPTPADERAAITRMERSGVRLAIVDASRAWPGYGHGRFGETFQRRVAAWLTLRFDRVATLREGDRVLTVWQRRS